MMYFGFGIAPSMFPDNCMIERRSGDAQWAKDLLKMEQVQSCLNPSHKATIAVMTKRYNIDVPIPERAPSIVLKSGDSIMVMGVTGLPRLENRHEYTDDEVNGAKFTFSIFWVL